MSEPSSDTKSTERAPEGEHEVSSEESGLDGALIEYKQMTEDRKELSNVFNELQVTLQQSSRRPPQETSQTEAVIANDDGAIKPNRMTKSAYFKALLSHLPSGLRDNVGAPVDIDTIQNQDTTVQYDGGESESESAEDSRAGLTGAGNKKKSKNRGNEEDYPQRKSVHFEGNDVGGG